MAQDDSGPQSGSLPTGGAPVALGRGAGAPRRRDARANRARLLDAARSLVRERTLAAVSVDEIAHRAGVGKGTVYRAFGDKAGIAVALLDDDERALQAAILSGPPPLGRGAPALDRLRAFAAAYLDLLERSVDLLLVADRGTPGARHRSGAYAFWLAHLTGLLAGERGHEGGHDGGHEGGHDEGRGDVEGAAHAVLAVLDPDLFFHLRRDRGYPLARVGATVDAAVRGIAGGPLR
ncbi:MAG TPA: helix-turn-helix domain-containing protein [Acidimicrobiales bacterium]